MVAYNRSVKPASRYTFPPSFLFGASTSAHQVEGNTPNDWSAWEAEHAESLAQTAAEHPPAGGWQGFILGRYPNALTKSNYISGLGCDHYHRYEEDFDLARQLGHTTHRFSIEWSRIEPHEDTWSSKELDHYRDVITALRSRNIEPIVTLWHWTLPLWLANIGGVRNPRFPEYFARYVETVVTALGSDVRIWITLNEPEVYALNGYLRGVWPPQKRGIFNYIRSTNALIRTHRRAYETIKRLAPESSIGIAANCTYFESAGGPINAALTAALTYLWNNRILDAIRDTSDFIGLNYYFRNRINYGINKNKGERVSDVGWEIYPEGIYHLLTSLAARYAKPIYVTENGLADARDTLRADFIREHLSSVARALQEGVDVRAYCYWSLLDNFEWDKGFWPRFGLIDVDYGSLERTVRPSALAYKKIITDGIDL